MSRKANDGSICDSTAISKDKSFGAYPFLFIGQLMFKFIILATTTKTLWNAK